MEEREISISNVSLGNSGTQVHLRRSTVQGEMILCKREKTKTRYRTLIQASKNQGIMQIETPLSP